MIQEYLSKADFFQVSGILKDLPGFVFYKEEFFANGLFINALGFESSHDSYHKLPDRVLASSDLQRFKDLIKIKTTPGSEPIEIEDFNVELKGNGQFLEGSFLLNILEFEEGEKILLAKLMDLKSLSENIGKGRSIPEVLGVNLFQFIVENGNQAFLVFEDFQIIYVSPAYLKLYGHIKGESNSFSLIDIFGNIHPEDRIRIQEEINEALNEKKTYQRYEFRSVDKMGGYRWREDQSYIFWPERESDSRYSIVFSRLIHEQKQQEFKYLESQGSLLEAQKIAKVGIWEFNLETQNIKFSAEGNRIFGYDPNQGEVPFNQALARVYPDDRKRAEAIWANLFLDEKTVEQEFRIEVPGEELRYVLCKKNVVLNDLGTVIGAGGVVHDITQLRNNEATLKHNFVLKRILLETAKNFINLPKEKFDLALYQVLEKLGSFVNADRSYIFEYDFDLNLCHNTMEWCAEGVEPQIRNFQNIPFSGVDSWVKIHKKGKSILIRNVDELKEGKNKEIIKKRGIKGLYAIPFMQGKKCLGFVGFDWLKGPLTFSEKEKELLAFFCEIYVNTRNRLEMEEALEQTEMLFSNASELGEMGGWIFDPIRNKSLSTKSLHRLLEIDPDGPNHLDFGWSLIADPASREKMKALVANTFETGLPFDTEVEFQATSGKRFWARVMGTLHAGKQGENKLIVIVQDISKVKSKIEQLRFQSHVLNAVNEGVIATDKEGLITYMNPEAEKMFEKEQASVKGKYILDEIKTGIPEDISTQILAGLPGGEEFSGVYRLEKESGEKRFFRTITNSVLNENGDFIGAVVITADVTDQIQISRKLGESERMFRSFVENANELILILNNTGKITYAAPNVFFNLGFRVEELVDQSFERILQPDFVSTAMEKLNLGMAKHQGFKDLAVMLNDKSGKGKWFSLSTSPILNKGGRMEAYLVFAFEIGKLKETERKLIRSEKNAKDQAARYKSILDSQTVYIVKTDALGNYSYINNYFIQKFGLDAKIIGTSSLNYIVPDDWQKCRETVERCFAMPNVFHEVTLRKTAADGSIYFGKWEFKGITNSEGQIEEIFCVGFDVSNEVQTMEKISGLLKVSEIQNERLKNFAYIVSHNIRSHSANIGALVNYFFEAQSMEEKLEFMDMLKISSDRLDSTLKNLSDILTLTTDEIEKVQIVLYPEIQKTLDIVRSEVLGETFEFRIDIPHRLQIMAVPSYLDSILLNLISNSIKYRNPDITCEIEIQAWSEGGLTHVSIRDNGLGIPLERVGKHVFGLYKTFHRNANARGLGLFMTKIQIDSMGGRISVESKPMKGSTFTFSLPS